MAIIKPKIGISPGVSASQQVDGDTTASISAGIGPSGPSVTPKIQVGQGSNAQLGGAVGSTAGNAVGTALGGPVGGAAGSAVGSTLGSAGGDLVDKDPKLGIASLAVGGPTLAAGLDIGKKVLGGGNSVAHQETKSRNKVFNGYKSVFGDDFVLPDGSQLTADEGGTHPWANPSRAGGKEKNRDLNSYETDYTSDLDYTSGMMGITLSRMVKGGKSKAIDQGGNHLGNKFLGKVGYNGEFNQDNFNKVVTNAKAAYAKAGVQSKDDFTALANKLYSEGRVNDSDYAAMSQTGDMLFNNDYSLATQLMSGRWEGLKTAGKTPDGSYHPASAGAYKDANGQMFAPRISPQEAQLSVQPILDFYKANGGGSKPKLSTGANIAQGLGLVTGAAMLYKNLNKLTGGAIHTGVKDAVQGITDYLSPGGDDLDPNLDFSAADNIPSISGGDIGDASDLNLGDSLNFDF